MPPRIAINKLSRNELLALKLDVENMLELRAKEERQEVRRQVESLVAESGFSLPELIWRGQRQARAGRTEISKS